MLISFHRGQGSIVLRVKILDSSATTGAGLTGLTFASSGLIISTIANNEASATAYTVAGSTIETIATLGTYAAPTATKCRFKEVDSTNHKGIYEIQIADARFAVSSAKALIVSISGATNAAQCDALIPLTDVDPYSTSYGLTLAKTTNITGFNDIAATAIVSSGAITTSGGAVSTVSTVTAATLANGAHTITGLTINGALVVSNASGTAATFTGGGAGHAIMLTAGTTGGNGLHIYSDGGDGIFSNVGNAGAAMYLSSPGGAAIDTTDAIAGILADITGTLSGSVGSIATGGITTSSMATGAITAAAMSQAAADKVWSTTGRTITGGTIGTYTGNTPQTGDSFARIGANGASLTTLATQASIDGLPAGVWANTGRTVTGGTITTYTGNTPQTGDAFARLGAPVGASISADIAAKPTAAANASAVWNEAQSGHTTSGTFGKFLDSAVSGVSTGGISAADIAAAVFSSTAVEGVAFSTHVSYATAGARGHCTPVNNGNGTYTLPIKMLDGVTTAFTIIYNPSTGART